ncbi:MAG: hypothetical protein GY940_08915 [bacterium]|nr:hypothetical protein [bacterium]
MGTHRLIYIAAIAVIVLLLVIIIAIARSRKRNRQQEEAQAGQSGSLPKGASGEDTYEGITYSYKHFKGTDKAPPYFRITIPCTSSGSFKIQPETKFDRFFKKLGVCIEIETHDPTFDDAFYITTGKIPFTRDAMARSGNRRSIQAMFGLGFNHLKHDGQSIILTWNRFPRRTQMERATMEKAVAQLGILAQKLPNIQPYESPDSSNWKIKRITAFALPIFLLISGLITLIIGFKTYTPLDKGQVFVNSLGFSLPLFVFFSWIALHLLKGRSSSHRQLIAVFFISLVAFPLAGVGYNAYLNGVLDNHPPSVYDAKVIHKYYTRSKSNYSYYAVVTSWRETEDTEKLRVSRRFYDSLRTNSSTITVTTKPGKFGYQWIVGIR